MHLQRQVLGHPEDLAGVYEPAVELGLGFQRVAPAGRALEVRELHHDQRGLGGALVGVPRPSVSQALRIRREPLGLRPQGQAGRCQGWVHTDTVRPSHRGLGDR